MCLLFRLRHVFPQEGSLSNIESWKGVDHIILLSRVLISSLARVGITKYLFPFLQEWVLLNLFCYCYLIRLQLSVYRGNSGIQAIMNSNARRLAEQDESKLMASGIPYTIIRAGVLKNTPGQQGFSFKKVLPLA